MSRSRYAVYLCPGPDVLDVPAPECPNAAEHTPCPTGYLNWHEWAAEMSRTHRQQKCPSCGLWMIWKAKGKAKPKSRAREAGA